jgi:Zn-dependent metalloprotease
MQTLKHNTQPHRIRLCQLLMLLACLLSMAAQAQVARSSASAAHENFDLRDPELQGKEAAAVVARFREASTPAVQALRTQTVSAMLSAQAALAQKLPSVQLEKNRAGNAVEVVGTRVAGEWLKPASGAAHETTARAFLTEQAALFGLTAEQVAGLIKFSDYTNPAGNMSWVEFRQELNGIPVFQGEVRLAFNAGGALARTTGNLAAGMDATTLVSNPALTAAQAVVSAGNNTAGSKLWQQGRSRATSALSWFISPLNRASRGSPIPCSFGSG